MIQIDETNEIQNGMVTIFFSSDEPLYKYFAVFLKMLKDHYATGLEHENDIQTAYNSKFDCYGKRIKFYRINNIIRSSGMSIKKSNDLSISMLYQFGKPTVSYKVKSDTGIRDTNLFNTICDIASENYINAKNLFLPELDASYTLKKDHIFSDNFNFCNTLINYLIFFESNYSNLDILRVLTACNDNNTTKIRLNLRDISKLNKYISILQQIERPSAEAIKKFIEICIIFKTSKSLLKNLKVGAWNFTKEDNYLNINLLNFKLISDQNFNKFKYLDHPGVNFAASFLDKTNTLSSIETHLSKEILTNI